MDMVREAGYKKIHLWVQSGGGNIFEMFPILAEMERFKRDGGTITAHVAGICASAAVPIYLMADVRTMDSNAWLMMHPNSLHGMFSDKYDNPTNQTLFRKLNDKINKEYAQLVADRTKMTYEQALTRLTTQTSASGQWWMSAEECLDRGFAHDLI